MEEELPIILFLYIYIYIYYPKHETTNTKLCTTINAHTWLASQGVFHSTIVHITGVALPFRDLHQLTWNITYFASMAWKMHAV